MNHKLFRLFYVWIFRRNLYNRLKNKVKSERKKYTHIQEARLRAYQDRDKFSLSDLEFDDTSGIIRIRVMKKRKVLYQHPKYHAYKLLYKKSK